ncbi:MAG: hypothetical protein KDE27_32820 [Planctomycetes bacterium]|nr:hypothetical protein [Planctomycetota bacterium]
MIAWQTRSDSPGDEIVELSLGAFLRRGMSFSICREIHAWPPLRTLNAFLAVGVDDVEGGGLLHWPPFQLT